MNSEGAGSGTAASMPEKLPFGSWYPKSYA